MEETNDDGQEISKDVHTVKYVAGALAIREKHIKMIEKTIIASRQISISDSSDVKFTKKWQEQMEVILLKKGDSRQIQYVVDAE